MFMKINQLDFIDIRQVIFVKKL